MKKTIAFLLSANLAAPAGAATTAASKAQPGRFSAMPGARTQAAWVPAQGLRSVGNGLDDLSRALIPAVKAPETAAGKPTYAEMTGAANRVQADPGPVKKAWVVHEAGEDVARYADVLERLKRENPGIELRFIEQKSVLPYKEGKKGPEVDHSPEARRILLDRIMDDKADLVLATNADLYEHFRGMRDNNLALDLPMGIIGRRYISVVLPRESLNPGVLSDPTLLAHRNYVQVTYKQNGDAFSAGGMRGRRVALEQLIESVKDEEIQGHGIGGLAGFGQGLLVKLAGEGDDAKTALTRDRAHRLAAYVERESVDALVVDTQEGAEAAAMMKSMGYHLSLPVIWNGMGGLADETLAAMNLATGKSMSLRQALETVPTLKRLPDNFMGQGGVGVLNPEEVVGEVVKRATPDVEKAGSKRYDIHFMLTNGNGSIKKGDGNPFGHFGMAVTDENGKLLVWTVQYNDGGSFTGGLGAGRQLTLAEYIYASNWYLPGANGQAVPQAETAAASLFDFILKGAVDEAGLEAMRRVAAYINVKHLRGDDRYEFLNKDGMTNCISMVTQMLRAAGFAIAETGIQAPADKAVEMIMGLARRVLSNRAGAQDMGFVIFDKPAHSGPPGYRIPNTAMGSTFFNRTKTWSYMNFWEKVWRVITWPRTLRRAFGIARTIKAFSEMATHKVIVGPNSRGLEVLENTESPLTAMRQAAQKVAALRRERVAMEEESLAAAEELLKYGGIEGWSRSEGAAPQPKSPEENAREEALRARYKELELKLALSLFDEQLALRAIEYSKIRVADPLGRYARRLNAAIENARQAHALREIMVSEKRLLTEEEIDQLNRLNMKLEAELGKLQRKLLDRLGAVPPHDMNMVARQLSLKAIDAIVDGKSGAAGKGKDGKK